MRAVPSASALRAQVDDAATRLDAGLAQASSSLSRLEALEKERQATHDAEALAAGGAATRAPRDYAGERAALLARAAAAREAADAISIGGEADAAARRVAQGGTAAASVSEGLAGRAFSRSRSSRRASRRRTSPPAAPSTRRSRWPPAGCGASAAAWRRRRRAAAARSPELADDDGRRRRRARPQAERRAARAEAAVSADVSGCKNVHIQARRVARRSPPLLSLASSHGTVRDGTRHMARDFGTTRGQLYTQAQATSYGLGSRGAGGGSARASRAGGRRGRRRRGRRGRRRGQWPAAAAARQGSRARARRHAAAGCWRPGATGCRGGAASGATSSSSDSVSPSESSEQSVSSYPGPAGRRVHRTNSLPVPTVLPFTVAHTLQPGTFCSHQHGCGHGIGGGANQPYGGQVGSCSLVDGIGFTVAEVCGIPDGRDGERRRRVCFDALILNPIARLRITG